MKYPRLWVAKADYIASCKIWKNRRTVSMKTHSGASLKMSKSAETPNDVWDETLAEAEMLIAELAEMGENS